MRARRRLWLTDGVVVLVVLCLVAVSCGGGRKVLGSEPFRSFVPDNARLLDDSDDGGSSIVEPGESVVIRTFEAVAPATPSDVIAALVDEGTREGWAFSRRDADDAFGSKTLNGNVWTVSLALRDGGARQVFAGR